MGEAEVADYLTHLALRRHVAAATQNPAWNAIVFLYREVLGRQPGELDRLVRARRTARLPVVLTAPEVQRVLSRLRGASGLASSLMYRSGLRLMETMQLRVKHLNFGLLEIAVRDGKGRRDRVTMPPETLGTPLRHPLEDARLPHEEDLAEGFGSVHFPAALERKLRNAAQEWGGATMIDTHVLNRGGRSVESPLGGLGGRTGER